MDSTKLLSLLENLDDEIDDLEESLAPVVKVALSHTASRLPLLDKAKLYVLVTYALESILFSYLRLNGIRAREHPVFVELNRVKQYFDKIKLVETPPSARGLVLDKGAAARFIKAGLSGSNKQDLQRAEIEAKDRLMRMRRQVPSADRDTGSALKRNLVEAEGEIELESTSSDPEIDGQSKGVGVQGTELSPGLAASDSVAPRSKKRRVDSPDATTASSTSRSSKEGSKTSRRGGGKARKENTVTDVS